MSGTAIGSGHRGPELVSSGDHQRSRGWTGMITSADHKDVGRVYISASLAFLFLGMVAYLLMRLQLAVPDQQLIEPVTFNRVLSVGSVSLGVLFVAPLAMGLYTYIVPLQIGARGTAFPRLGQLSAWLYVFGGAILYLSLVYTPPEAGLNALPPLSDTPIVSNNGIDVWTTAIGLTTLGLVLQSINLIVTLKQLKAPGFAWRRLPMFSCSAAVSSWVLIVAGTAMLAALTMLEIDRHFNGVFFEPGEGGAPGYYQHLSYIFFTGVYLLMVLPAVGAISEIIPVFSGKPLLSRSAVTASMVAIGVLGLLAWMENMFTASIPKGFLYATMLVALLLIVPFGLIFANWLGTLAGGSLRLRAPMVFALASFSTLSFGLLGELAHALVPVNTLLAGTSDATAETGYVLIGGAVLGGLAALHYWFPKMTGRTVNEGMAKASALTIVAGAHLMFIPLVMAGLEGMPSDVYRFYDGAGLDGYNLVATLGALVIAGGVTLSLANLMLSASAGPRAGHDPWGGDTLEWFALSPPPPHNFDVVPDVRSDEPLRDIREAVQRLSAQSVQRAAGSDAPSGTPGQTGEPVA